MTFCVHCNNPLNLSTEFIQFNSRDVVMKKTFNSIQALTHESFIKIQKSKKIKLSLRLPNAEN